MPTYEIDQYELHVLRHRIEADSEADAVVKLLQGEGEPISFEFVGIANDYGTSLSENPDLTSELFDRGVIDSNDLIIPSIRSVSVVRDEVADSNITIPRICSAGNDSEKGS
jgi:hypothetical protein